MGKPEGKGSLGTNRRRWENTIKTDSKDINGTAKEWIDLAQGSDRWRALINKAMNVWVPKIEGNCSAR